MTGTRLPYRGGFWNLGTVGFGGADLGDETSVPVTRVGGGVALSVWGTAEFRKGKSLAGTDRKGHSEEQHGGKEDRHGF